ncbi:MAG TPA: hypothetical protein VD866_29970 [Urbifossiella sp.]|nr:hypothetical protein [Urbifossiella sp.]
MTIDTRWNIGDRPWAVIRWVSRRDATCVACGGGGGANIPGTGVWVKCQACDGEGTTEEQYDHYDPVEGRVSRIGVDVDEGGRVATTYSGYYRSAVHPERFAAVFATEAEAVQWANARISPPAAEDRR